MIDPGSAVAWGMLITVLMAVAAVGFIAMGAAGIFGFAYTAREVREAVGVLFIGFVIAGLAWWGYLATETLRRMVEGS